MTTAAREWQGGGTMMVSPVLSSTTLSNLALSSVPSHPLMVFLVFLCFFCKVVSWKLSTGEDSGRGIRQYPSEPYHPLQLIASDCKRAINFVSCLLPVAANDRPARRTIVAPRDRRSIAAVLDRCCASLACLLLSAVIVVDLHCFAMVIANVVLHRWHFQERKVNAAVHRRFLNVTGTGGALQAKVHFRGDARVAPQLFLELRNCRPNADRQGASLRIPGLNVSALAVASSRVASSAERTDLGLPAEQDAVAEADYLDFEAGELSDSDMH